MKQYVVLFEENEEYVGYMYVTCEIIKRDEDNEKVFFADGIKIELDERIVEIDEA